MRDYLISKSQIFLLNTLCLKTPIKYPSEMTMTENFYVQYE